MAYNPPRLRGNKQKPIEIVLDDFSGGQVTLIDEARLDNKSAREASNLMQDQDGLWTKRWGTANYGTALSTSIDGVATAVKDDGDGTTTQYLLAIDGGTAKRSEDGGAWTTLTLNGGGAFSLTASKTADLRQLGSKVYIANATDRLSYYDIANDYMVSYTGISAPSNVSASATVIGGSTYSNYYRVSAVNDVGETLSSAPATANTQTTKARDNWATDGTEYITVTWDAVTGAEGYNIYWSDTEGYEILVGTSSSTSFIDDGTATPNEFVETPDDDTTAGPKLGALEISSNRLWGTLDPDNPFRVYASGTGNQLGSFSPYYGGAWVDLQKGGDERPVAIKHFRDGRGNPATLVFTKSPQGNGSTWVVELINATVGGTNIVIPTSYQITGSVGAVSNNAIVEAENSIFGYSRLVGFTSLGTKPTMLNVLATDEISVKIRDFARSLNEAKLENITGIYHDGKVLWSVPFGSTTNNRTIVLDLENRNWATGWSIGFRKFVRYTESDGSTKLLGVPATGNQLLELSSNYLTDSGDAISTKYRSGLIHFDKSQISFAYIRKVHFILGRPKGDISLTINGTKRNKVTSTIASKTVSAEGSDTGLSWDDLSDLELSDSTGLPNTFAQAAVKKTVKVNKLLNNIQVEISSSGADTRYTILRIIVEGMIIPINEPSSWRN